VAQRELEERADWMVLDILEAWDIDEWEDAVDDAREDTDNTTTKDVHRRQSMNGTTTTTVA
jgi:hypothetical protein